VVEALLDLPALGHRLLLAGQQQGARQQGLAELGEQRLDDGVVGDAYPDGFLLGVQQAARHLAGGREDERVLARRRRLHRPEQRVVDLYERAELGEVAAHEGEVVAGVQAADLPDPVDAVLVAEPGAEREARVGRIGDQPVAPQDVDHLSDRSGLRVVGVHVEVLRHPRSLCPPGTVS
jgi:hypothetical protein